MKKKFYIEPGCIGCGLCEALAPQVFKVQDVSHIRDGVDHTKYQEKIKVAQKLCPMGVIVYEE